MDPTFVDKTRQWLELDTQATKIKETLAEVTDAKKVIEEDILNYVEEHELDKVTINVSDGRIKFPTQKVKQTLSLKYVKGTLAKYQEEKGVALDIEAIYKYLVDNLETKTKLSIKREVR